MKKILPILLGTDSNVYGMARSFFEEYGVVSEAYGKGSLSETKYSKIVNVNTVANLDDNSVFIKTMVELGKKYKDMKQKPFLLACGDGYVELVIKNQKMLKQYFIVPVINESLREQLESKTRFYEMCEKYNLDFPKTVVCNKGQRKISTLPFEFPVALKPSDSISYANCKFNDKKKCYKINSIKELNKTINIIFNNGYKESLIIQEFIPGNAETMFVLNAYSDRNSKVKMMCLGNCVVEDCTPANIGNYDALISCSNEYLYDKIKKFLEEINYVGFSNFDFKYDYRDQKYKLFEINIRQGRSSYFTTAAGCNLAKYLVEDYINNTNKPCEYNYNNWLWLNISLSTIKKIKTDKKILNKIKQFVHQKKYCYTLWYKKDLNIKRVLIILLIYKNKKRNHLKSIKGEL